MIVLLLVLLVASPAVAAAAAVVDVTGRGDVAGVLDVNGQFDLLKPFLLCNPTTLDGTAPSNPVHHPACYKMTGPDLANADRLARRHKDTT